MEKLGHGIIARGKGYPDIMVLKDGKLVFHEIRTGNNPLDAEQRKVLTGLRKYSPRTVVWRYRKDKDDFSEDVAVEP